MTPQPRPQKIERKFPTVSYTEYDALCDLVAEMADCSSTDLVAAVRRTTGDVEADWIARIVDGERTEELFRARF